MRIAIGSNGLDVAPRFDMCDSFTIYTVKKGIVTSCQNIPNPKVPTTDIINLLGQLGVGTFIVGAILEDSAQKYYDAGIEVIAEASGPVRNVLDGYLTHTLISIDEMCKED